MNLKRIGASPFFVSEEGRIFRELKCRNTKGYRHAHLRWGKGKFRISEFVHRLVAMAFIPNSENKPLVDHLNSVRDDNRRENLRWATHSENWDGAKGDDHYNIKMSDEEVVSARNDYDAGVAVKVLCERYGICESHMYRIVNRSRRA